MADVIWIEGELDERVFTLSENGAVMDLSGAQVSVVLRPAARIGGKRIYPAVIVSASEGKVGWTPFENQLKASESPYTMRFRVALGSIVKHVPFPASDTWTVVE
jgi:hypothetical protein